MHDSQKAQDLLKARVIATGFSIFFLIMGILTIYGRHYNIPVDLISIKQIMLAEIDLYMGLVQMSLALIPLVVWFENNIMRLYWSVFATAMAGIFFLIMFSKIM